MSNGATSVVRGAVTLLARHWPMLLALALGARAGRSLVMTAAVRASKINGVVGGLIFVLVPIVTLAALVLMLRLVARSLPGLDAPDAAAGGDPAAGSTASPARAPRRLVDYTASVLVPFLAMYASYGNLKKDGTEYLRRVFNDEVMANADLFNNPGKIDVASRLPFTVGYTVVATVIVAVVLRWLLSRWEGGRTRRWPAVLGAYIEVTWITLVARQISQLKRIGTEWVEQRRIVRWAEDAWSGTVDGLRSHPNGAIKTAVAWLGNVFGSVDVVIVLPLAWLAVGAVVYGRELEPLPPPTSRLYDRAAQKLSGGPRAVRRVATELGTDLYGRFAPLVHSLRVLFRAGWSSMLLFWLAFLIAQTAPQWLWELERLSIGPRDLGLVWAPLSGPLAVLNDAIGNVLLICLLAAAIDRALNPPAPAPVSAPDAPVNDQPPVSRA